MSRLKKLSESYQWVDSISNKTIIEFLKTNDMLQEIHTHFFKKYNISNTRFNVLVILYKGPKEGMFLSEIGEQMLVSNANITGLIDRLEKQKLVKRIRGKKDRRKIIARITDLGIQTIEEVIEHYRQWSNQIMNILEDDEKAELISLLTKLKKGIIYTHSSAF